MLTLEFIYNPVINNMRYFCHGVSMSNLFLKCTQTMESKKQILIVDDSNTALLLMEYALKEAGYDTMVASSAKEAFDLISNHLPDLILLDLSMPEISGYDFLKMKAELHLENIPILVVSANDSAESIEMTRNLGAADFIAKPIKLDSLMEKIRTNLKI